MSALRDSYEKTKRALAEELAKRQHAGRERELALEARLQELFQALKADQYLSKELGLTPERVNDEVVLLNIDGAGLYTIGLNLCVSHWIITDIELVPHYVMGDVKDCLVKLGEVIANCSCKV